MSSSTVEDLAMDSQVNNVTDSSNVTKPKQPAWNKQPISTVAAADTSDFGSVMGDFSWPALSKSAKASPKSSSDSLKCLSDGSVSAPQVKIPIFFFCCPNLNIIFFGYICVVYMHVLFLN